MKDHFFIHIPKTAGATIKSMILKASYGHVPRTKIKLSNRFVFTFIRNPFDRLVSVYSFNRGKLRDKNNIRGFKKMIENLDPYSKENIKINKGFFPLHWWIENKDGEIDIDFIGRFENLEKDLRELSKLIKRELLLGDNHSNKSMRRDIEDYYTPDLKEIVYKKYKKDFDLFYPKEYLNAHT